MQTATQTFEYPVIYNGRRTPLWSYSRERVTEICFNLIEFFGDCWIGIMIGAIVGWISGWSVAAIYRSYCEPTDFISFEIIDKWQSLPYEYAREGMAAGAAGGVLIILALTFKNMMRKLEQETDQNTVKMK